MKMCIRDRSLKAYGVKYEQIDLVNDDFDDVTILERLKENNVRLVEIQRSRGYSHRLSLSIAKIERIIKKIREVNKAVSYTHLDVYKRQV